MLKLIPQKIKAKATVSGLRISAIDGTAFLDNLPVGIMNEADPGDIIEIYDSTGKCLRSWVGAQGTGETLGSELALAACCTDPLNDQNNTTGWTPTAGGAVNSIAGGNTGSCLELSSTIDIWCRAYCTFSRQTGALFTTSLYQKNGTTGLSAVQLVNLTVATVSNSGWTSLGPFYRTDTGTGIGTADFRIQIGSSTTGSTSLIDDVTVKQVTAPSTSGSTIVNAINGTTQNFLTKDADFAYNAASYTVRVKRILPAEAP